MNLAHITERNAWARSMAFEFIAGIQVISNGLGIQT